MVIPKNNKPNWYYTNMVYNSLLHNNNVFYAMLDILALPWALLADCIIYIKNRIKRKD